MEVEARQEIQTSCGNIVETWWNQTKEALEIAYPNTQKSKKNQEENGKKKLTAEFGKKKYQEINLSVKTSAILKHP